MPAMRIHPCKAFAESVGFDPRRAAHHFGIPYSSYRRMVSGHYTPSVKRCRTMAEKSRGTFSYSQILDWHEAA